MNSRTSIWTALSALLVIFAAGVAAAAPEGSRWGRNWFPNHEVTAHTGEKFRFYDELIENKIVVVNFIYTSCTDICPLQTARLAMILEAVGDRVGKDIFVYSITLDPEVDTPEVLASLAEAYDTGPGWLFLTGNPDELAEIRYKVGDRSRSLSDHRNDLMLGNDIEGFWQRSSLFGDVEVTAREILAMDPDWRERKKASASTDAVAPDRREIASDVGRGLFVKTCAACHNIGGGPSIGPDLLGVLDRRDRDWLASFIQDAERMRREGDPLAIEIDAEWPGIRMPGLSFGDPDVRDLLTFIENEEKRIEAGGGPLVRGFIQRPSETADAAD